MFFTDLQRSLLDNLRVRIRNGELTERSLAKLTGVSQPHIHNVLKGARILSVDVADRILSELHLSVLDLLDQNQLAAHLQPEPEDALSLCYISILEGKIGPKDPWPASVDAYERVPISRQRVAAMTAPLVARLGADSRMQKVFSEGDLVLLDQSRRARTVIEPDAYYAVKKGAYGIIRRVRWTGQQLFLVSDDCLERPSAWERIEMAAQEIRYFVRAKAILVTPELEWKLT